MPLIVGARQLRAVVTWKPFVATAVGTSAWLALTARPSGLLLSLASAAVAASTSHVLDDPAAATLRSSPTTMLPRRAHRVTLAVPLLATWWALAATIVAQSSPPLPMAAYTLQLTALVAIGLAGSSVTSRLVGDQARGSTTGALAVLLCFGTRFLPERSLQLVPVDLAAADTVRQLAAVLAVAVALLLGASLDPTRRIIPRRLRRPATAKPGV